MILLALALCCRVVGTAPRNTANFTFAYSTDDSSYTPMTNITNVTLPELIQKMIERRLLGTTFVDIFPARFDYGTISFTTEYGSALFNTLFAFYTGKTLVYLKATADDTGGTNGASFKSSGYMNVNLADIPADDAVKTVTFSLRCRSFAFTAAV